MVPELACSCLNIAANVNSGVPRIKLAARKYVAVGSISFLSSPSNKN